MTLPKISRREFSLSLLGGVCAFPFTLQQPAAMRVNGKRLWEHLQALSRYGNHPRGGVSRVAYSEADRQGRDYVSNLMRNAALEVSVDAAGNLIGRRRGSESGLQPIALGSHIDSVPEGGNFDGTLGSLAAVEASQVLAERRFVTRHPLEVIVFQNEEGGQWGSRLMIGAAAEADLSAITHSGKIVRDGIRFIGGDPGRLQQARREPGSFAAYVELHIEQGGVLESERIQIGIVEGIVGINRHEVTITGAANHAGTTPMSLRQDALLAAAGVIEAVHSVVTSRPGRQVGTVGKIQAFPGAPNVIAGQATLTIELRDLDWDKIQSIYRGIVDEARRIEKATRTEIRFREIYANRPAPTDPGIRRAVAAAAEALGYSSKLMPSGAGHDAQGMSRLCPMGMIFVPSAGGISHSPKEYSSPEDVERGANVLLHTLLLLDSALR